MPFATPSRDFTDGTLVFSAGVDSRIPGHTQFPHRWKLESRQLPHIHYKCSTAGTGTIKFTFEYNIANINEDFASDYTLLSTTVDAPASTSRHVLTPLGLVEMTGYDISSIMQWRIARLGTEDTYAGSVKLMYFVTHVVIDSLGSVYPLVKL